eukprot:scaffold52098_cov37-Tisochrysis_lutea.AAC.1
MPTTTSSPRGMKKRGGGLHEWGRRADFLGAAAGRRWRAARGAVTGVLTGAATVRLAGSDRGRASA